LQVLRARLAARSNPLLVSEVEVPDTAKAIAEVCIRSARHSSSLLTECWISGSFPTFDYFYTQYLFSVAFILAISSLLDERDYRNDADSFETAVQFLEQLGQNGNLAAKEFCWHIDSFKLGMEELRTSNQESSAQPAQWSGRSHDETGLFSEAGKRVTTEIALAEPSLQEFLAQPDFDLQFIDTSMYYEGLQTLYQP
jgi:proline utilization trans-activator